MPAYCTGLGKAMLAFDDAAADEVMSSTLPRRTELTITEPSALRADLDQVRSVGVARDVNESYDGPGVRGRADPQLRPGDRRGVGDRSGAAAWTGTATAEAVK